MSIVRLETLTVCTTVNFEVIKLNRSPVEGPLLGTANSLCYQQHRIHDIPEGWEKISGLDGDVAFLVDNQSMCLKASDVPGYKPNCIYFTNDNLISRLKYRYSPLDIIVFNMEDSSVQLGFTLDLSNMDAPYPFWVFLTSPEFQSKNFAEWSVKQCSTGVKRKCREKESKNVAEWSVKQCSTRVKRKCREQDSKNIGELSVKECSTGVKHKCREQESSVGEWSIKQKCWGMVHRAMQYWCYLQAQMRRS